MNIPLLFLWIYFLYGVASATATDFSRKCRVAKELNDLCGEHTYQSISPILRYVEQLQEETREINDLRKKVKELELKLAEGKFKDDIIATLNNTVISKNEHIQDLQDTNSKLWKINRVLTQNVESVNSAIDHFKLEFSKIDLNVSNLSSCKEKLLINNRTITQNTAQLKSKDEDLKSCALSLSIYEDQSEIQNKKIVENTSSISQLKAELNLYNQTLRESQSKLEENQDDIRKLKEIIQQKDQEVSKFKEQIKEYARIPTTCTTNGDSNGIHNVILPNIDPFPALCNSDIAGPGWTVIQQRINGGEVFYRNWEDYKNGFGNFTGDFFLGLERIHRLTKDTPHELYIYMEAFKGGEVKKTYKSNTFYARYDNFSIAGEDDKYRLLSLGSYSGNSEGDWMRFSELQQFSTFDSDNDKSKNFNCAKGRHAGWWYNACGLCNLNGKYYQKEVDEEDSNWWFSWYSLKTIKIMIRPRGK